jgi:hypothetical protein
MNLKNYTSSVPVDITLARIERLLVDSGATGIAKEYKGGKVQSLVFQMAYQPDKLPMTIKLPANVENCLQAFWKDHCKSRSLRSRKTTADFQEQAERTAWKLQQDWVEVQTSLIRLNQQTAIQAFLPYVFDGQQTYYERLQTNNFRALLPESAT